MFVCTCACLCCKQTLEKIDKLLKMFTECLLGGFCPAYANASE